MARRKRKYEALRLVPFPKLADADAEAEYGTYGGAVGLSGGIEVSAPGDPVRRGPGFWGAFAFSFWALMGAACSAGLFLLSTGPIQACTGYGIWLSLAPPELLPAWTGHGSLGPVVFPLAHLGLESWLLTLIVFPVVGFRLSKAQWPRWRPKAWTCAAMAGMALAVLALVSYRLPPEKGWNPCDGSNPISYAKVPIIDWYEIPAAIGFLVLAAAMWWILTAPRHPARLPRHPGQSPGLTGAGRPRR
jgi:hypothetical protein